MHDPETGHPLTKGERREAQRTNERKMRVSGRSTLLLSELSRRLPKPRKNKNRRRPR